MKWNTKQKVSAAILAIAAAALCVDRFVLGYGPQSAAAATGPLAQDAPPTPHAAPGSPQQADSAHSVSLTQRVSALATLEPERTFTPDSDAFRAPAAWAPLAREPQKAAPAPAAEPKNAPAPTRFTVTSIFQGKGSIPGAARVNGKVLRIGDFVMGHRFDRIEPGSPAAVVLVGKDGEVRVPLTLASNLSDEGNPSSAESK